MTDAELAVKLAGIAHRLYRTPEAACYVREGGQRLVKRFHEQLACHPDSVWGPVLKKAIDAIYLQEQIVSALSKSLDAATAKIKELQAKVDAGFTLSTEEQAALAALQSAAKVDANGDPLPAA